MDNRGYFISAGQQGKMFTLRQSQRVYKQDGGFYLKDYHVCSLSIDLEKALAKAKEYTGLDLPAPEIDLEAISRRDKSDLTPDIVRFGYNKGASIYLLQSWELWRLNARSHTKNKKFRACLLDELLLRNEITEEAHAEMMESGFLDWRNNAPKMIKQFKYDYNKAKRQAEFEAKKELEKATSQFVGEIKERLELDVTLQFETSGEGTYGVWYLNKFTDSEGNVIVYMGSKYLGLEKGETARIKGTVKEHSTYEDVKQTKLQRVSIINA